MQSGKKIAAIRERKERPTSPCAAKPMTVMIAMARASPRMSTRLFIDFATETQRHRVFN
jgi:hypothetical protein